MAAKPTPSPPINLAITNCVKLSGTAEPRADSVNNNPDNNKTYLRPYLALRAPENRPPNTHPQMALEAAQPVSIGLSSNFTCKYPIAPAMTAVS